MQTATKEKPSRTAADDPSLQRILVLARLACSGEATPAGIARDLAPLVAHELTAAQWLDRANTEISQLTREGLAADRRGRLMATPDGKIAADRALGSDWPSVLPWSEQRDIRLVAKALGVAGESRSTLATLAKPDGLKAVILQKAFGLPIRSLSIPKLRGELAVLALERAFGNKIKSGFTEGAGLSAKAARLLAGHLSKSPRDFGTDGRLIAALAAEQAGSDDGDEAALRLAILRAFVSRGLKPPGAPGKDAPPSAPPLAPPARPDLPGFVVEVAAAARNRADGWPRKAYISHVWQEVRAKAPHWALSEIEFKCMLAEAHRAGRVVLATADLKDKKHLKDLEDSAVSYKNAVWHFVRVED